MPETKSVTSASGIDTLRTLACCVDVPPWMERKARYALTTLLRPLNLRPDWVPRGELSAGTIYYGTEPSTLASGVVVLPCSPDALRYFSGREPFSAGSVSWLREEKEEWPVLFRGGLEGEPDLVASAFFWLSGWQEWTVRERDEHGRFPFAASLQHRLGTARRPVVDFYRGRLAERFREAGIPTTRRRWAGRDWAFCATHDIDHLYKWRWRSLPGLLLAGTGGPKARARFLRDLAGMRVSRSDPYARAFERMIGEEQARGATATYFIKAGAYGRRDVPYSLRSASFRTRVAELRALGFEIGVHPGFHAQTHAGRMRQERARVGALSGPPTTSCRQHYLRYDVAATARVQVDAAFTIDSTLGFADHEGFRNGTCAPFQVYDPVADAPLNLWEMPLAAMDGTFFVRRGMSLDEACKAMDELMAACRRFGGVCVGNWHNLLWDEDDHPGWGAHFLHSLDHAARSGALMASLQQALNAWGEGTVPANPASDTAR